MRRKSLGPVYELKKKRIKAFWMKNDGVCIDIQDVDAPNFRVSNVEFETMYTHKYEARIGFRR